MAKTSKRYEKQRNEIMAAFSQLAATSSSTSTKAVAASILAQRHKGSKSVRSQYSTAIGNNKRDFIVR